MSCSTTWPGLQGCELKTIFEPPLRASSPIFAASFILFWAIMIANGALSFWSGSSAAHCPYLPRAQHAKCPASAHQASVRALKEGSRA